MNGAAFLFELFYQFRVAARVDKCYPCVSPSCRVKCYHSVITDTNPVRGLIDVLDYTFAEVFGDNTGHGTKTINLTIDFCLLRPGKSFSEKNAATSKAIYDLEFLSV